MISTYEFSQVVDDIYEAAVNADHWPATVARLCDVFRGVRADMSVLDGIKGTSEIQINHNFPDGLAEAIAINSHFNPLMPLVLVHPLQEPFMGERDYGLEPFKKSLYYRNVLSSVDVVDIMLLPLARKATVGAAITVSRGRDIGPFGDQDAELARLLIPHLQRAVDITRLMKRSASAEATIAGMLGAMAAPAILLGQDGAVLYANAAAEGEFRRATLLRLTDGKLAGRVPAVATFLSPFCQGAAEAPRSGDVLVRADERGEVLLTAVGLPSALAEGAAATLVVLRIPEPDLVSPIGVARDAFGLTNAEVSTLAQVMAGRSLQEAADLLGVARSTVKSHLDGIFAKAGVSRQTELVGKVMAMMRPLP